MFALTKTRCAALALAAACLAAPSAAVADITISMQDDATGGVGASVSIPITVNPVNGLHSFDIHVHYTSSVIVATGVTPAAATSAWGLNSNLGTPGEVLISLFSSTPLTGGAKDVANITFNVVGGVGATSPLVIVSGISDDNIVTHLDDGLFTVVCPAAPAGLTHVALPSPTLIGWSAVSGATAYDVVRGRVSTLKASGGNFTTSTNTCLGNDAAGTSLPEPATPPLSDSFWYLVRPVNCGGPGSYESGAPSQVGLRDAEIQAAGVHCP